MKTLIGKRMCFFATCVCILLPFLSVSLYVRMCPLSYVDGEAPYFIWNREVTNTPQNRYYPAIVLGDSTANAAYEPALLSDGTINLSLGGTTPIDSYYILQDWLSNNAAPKVCYISFMDMHFQIADWFWKRGIYLHRYSLLQDVEMLGAAIRFQEPTILAEHYIEDFVAYELCLPDKYMTTLIDAKLNQRHAANIAALQSNELHRGRYMTRGTFEYTSNDEIICDRFYVNPIFDEYYRKVIELCTSNNIKIRIIKLPLPDNYVFTDQYRTEFDEYYNQLKLEYPLVTVDWFPTYSKELFADVAHMNSHGSLRFCTELKKLYVEDFNEGGLSLRQADAINDSIVGENKVEEILKWINGRDYTTMILDSSGAFTSFYQLITEDKLMLDSLTMVPVSAEGLNGVELYCISGNGAAECNINVTTNGATIELEHNGKGTNWNTDSSSSAVVVFDNYHKEFVCCKLFNYNIDLGKYLLL